MEKTNLSTNLQGDVKMTTASNSSSLNLSITPPLLDEAQQQPPKHDQDEDTNPTSISEHLSSIENDRSLSEIQVESNQFSDLLLQNVPSDTENLSQEPKPVSFNYTSSNLSLNDEDDDVDNPQLPQTSDNNVKSILEEMLSHEESVGNRERSRDEDDDEETFNVFTNLKLDDKLIGDNDDKDQDNDDGGDYDEVQKRVKDFEELLAIKDSTIAALTTELDSYRELVSNQSSLGTSTTEYKQFQEECQNRLTECHNLILHKDELIKKLTESLQQSTANCEDLQQSKEELKNEILELRLQLENTTKLIKNQSKSCTNSNLKEKLENLQISQELQQAIIEICQQEFAEKLGHNHELEKLELKHAAEMEELRTYFEQKCADLEKNYSEEIFSQHSRKLSTSSTNTIDNQEELCDFVVNQQQQHQQLEKRQNLPLGPGGDNYRYHEYTRKDLKKLHTDLQKILQLFQPYSNNDGDVNLDQLQDNDFDLLKTEINKFDLRNLFKYDLGQIQNKYHAELEILHEDYDNRLDLINLENEKKLKDVEEKYCKEIDELKQQLDGFDKNVAVAALPPPQTTTQQEVVSGDFEIDEVIQSYEQRLQEQIALAKIDLINSLENQIQRLVTSEKFDDDDWPDELLRLKERFSEKYKHEMNEMEKRYNEEIDNLKNRLRQRQTNNNNNNNDDDGIVKECDFYKNQTIILRDLIKELLKHFKQCENELNNTIINDFINKNLNEIVDNDDNLIKKHLYFTPPTNDLLELIDNKINDDTLNLTQSSIDVKDELGNCLEKLKIDANELLLLTNNFNQSINKTTNDNNNNNNNKIVQLTQQLNESKIIIKTLEEERDHLEKQLDNFVNKQQLLEQDLIKAQNKISELIDHGRKEIVSQGYGEDGKSTTNFVDTVAVLNELQEKSRNILEHPDRIDQNVFEILDNYLRITEKLIDQAKKDREDYQQQIEVADKKYKSTCRFLEEQANEREQERDDAQKLINNLKEELRIRDKDRINHERVNQEVENLEQQIRDMSRLIDENEKRYQCVDLERKEAIEKIFVLRDIIRDLENQIEIKQHNESELRNLVKELEVLIKQQQFPEQHQQHHHHHQQQQQDADTTLEQIEQLHQQINELETELQRLRLNSEIAGSEGPIKQIRIHLNEFETTLDKCTKDLELHSTISTCCSSPSEDMSVRDVVHQDISNTVFDECEIPLQQLARLKEKLVRHSRAEDAAFKRIQDLEMQIGHLRTELDDNQNERDILKKQISDQLVLISSLQIRLDEQRIRAEHIEKQTNTSLEVRIYDLQDKLIDNEEKLIKKDKLIQQLQQQFDELKLELQKLKQQQNEQQFNDDLLIKQQEELEYLRNDNKQLKLQINNINILENLLKEKQQQLEIYKNLNLNQSQIDYLQKLQTTGVSFIDLIEQIEPVRKLDTNNSTQQLSPIHRNNKQQKNETILEISSIVHENLELPTTSSIEKRVHFQETTNERLQQLEKELQQRDGMINDYRVKLQKLEDLEVKVERLQQCLNETETILKQTSEQFNRELKDKIDEENRLKTTLDDLQQKNDQLNRELKTNQINYNELECVNSDLNGKLKQFEIDNREMLAQIERLQNDALRQQNLLAEKEKIIEQMTDDSRSLHNNLETIQNKLQETGNVVDLLQRLRDEQKRNVELNDEITNLKLQLFANDPILTTTTDIVGQVQKELNYSNYLDNVIVENVIEPMHDIELLQKKLDDEIEKCNRLEQQLVQIKIEDCKLIDELRQKLDMLINERVELEQLIDVERQKRSELEKELFSVKQQQQQGLNSEKTTESTDYRELFDVKLKKLQNECNLLKDNNQKLNDDLRLLKNEKLQIDTTLKSTQVLLNIKENENKQLGQQLEYLMVNEKRIQDELDNVRMKFEEKTKEIDDIQQDRLQMKRQMDVLNQRLKSTNAKDQVPAKLMEKIKEINTAVKDNIHLVDLVTRLNNEKTTLEQRIIDLEQQQQQQQQPNLPFDDPTSRANYLFAKYLRSDSYRKALIFQKRYLLSLLGTIDVPEYLKETTTKLNRFKIVVLGVMAVNRMKYLVKRWHSGKRIIQQRAAKSTTTTTITTRFQLGQPVSSQNFVFTNNHSVDEWTKHTPPTKDRRLPKSEPLASPNMLSKYVERFNQIQETLKLKGIDPATGTTTDSS